MAFGQAAPKALGMIIRGGGLHPVHRRAMNRISTFSFDGEYADVAPTQALNPPALQTP